MRKPLSNEDSVGIGLASFGAATFLSMLFQHFNRAALGAVEETVALSASVASALGFIVSLISTINIDIYDRDFAASPVNLKHIGIALSGIAAFGTTTGIMTYPYFKANEIIRQDNPSISPSSLIEVKLPRSKTGLKTAETVVCKPFAEEFAYKSDAFLGDDGRGSVLLPQNNGSYRVNCIPYIRRNEHKYPKPDK